MLAEDSPLRRNGTAVSHLLWGAAKLRHRSSEEARKARRGLVKASLGWCYMKIANRIA